MADQSSPTHYLSGKHIVIAGGGIAGLAFARALIKQWPSITTAAPPTITIYERDSAEDAIGREGYSLSLRSDPPGGIQALQKLGILDKMTEASIKNAHLNGGFCIWSTDWSPVIRLRAVIPPGLQVGSLRIARKNLRKVMIEGAEEVGCKIHWSSKCTSVSTAANGLTVTLESGEEVSCDMLIVADGASSKIRALLRPEDTLRFQNTVILGGTSFFGENTPPPDPIDRDWGMMPLNENRAACFFSPVGPNTALWSVSWRTDTPVSSAKPPVSDDVADWILKEARTRVAHPPKLFNELLEKTDRSSIMVLNARDKRAFAHNSQTLPEDFAGGKVIFIGDANHAVSPFAGNGANMALCDGWELASALLQAPNAAEGVENYDKLVVSQRNRIITQSHIAIAIGHSEGWRLWLSMLFLKFVRLLLFKYVR